MYSTYIHYELCIYGIIMYPNTLHKRSTKYFIRESLSLRFPTCFSWNSGIMKSKPCGIIDFMRVLSLILGIMYKFKIVQFKTKNRSLKVYHPLRRVPEIGIPLRIQIFRKNWIQVGHNIRQRYLWDIWRQLSFQGYCLWKKDSLTSWHQLILL